MALLLPSARALTRAHALIKVLRPTIVVAPFSSHAGSDYPKENCHSKRSPRGYEVAKNYVRIYEPRKYYCKLYNISQGGYNEEEITAEFKHGVHKIKIPKREKVVFVKVNSPRNANSECKVNSECQNMIDATEVVAEEGIASLTLLGAGCMLGGVLALMFQ